MQRIVLTGATGLLGACLVEALRARGDEVLPIGGAASAHGVELTTPGAFARVAALRRGDAVIHAAALSAVGDCARDPERARAVNLGGTRAVALACADAGARLVHVSTDMVFDGEAAPYDEDAPTAPTSVYARSKRDAEDAARLAPGSAVVRVSLLFGPSHNARRGFFDAQLEALREGREVLLFDDEWRTPLALCAAAEALLAVARSDFAGVLHVGGPERMSRLEMGTRLARWAGVSQGAIRAASRKSAGGEPRPRDVSLDSTRFRALFPRIATATFEAECARMGV